MALVIVMLALFVLTTLAAAIIFTTQTEVQATGNYKLVTQARYVAEAGAQSTLAWLSRNYMALSSFAAYDMTKSPVQHTSNLVVLSAMTGTNSNYPDSTVQTAFNSALNAQSVSGIPGATFSSYATLLSMSGGTGVSWMGGGIPQSWQITSAGTIGGLRPATVQLQVTYERAGTPLAPYAVFATSTSCPAITMTGGAKTDSYDSSSGSYAATVQATHGDVGTNGTLSVSGGTTIINGTAYLQTVTTRCPATFSKSVGPGVVQAAVAMGGPKTFANPVYPNPSPALTASTNYSSNQTLPVGNYGNIKMTGAVNTHAIAGDLQLQQSHSPVDRTLP